MDMKSYGQRETERTAELVDLLKFSFNGPGDYKKLTAYRNMISALHKVNIRTESSKSATECTVMVRKHHLLKAKIISNPYKKILGVKAVANIGPVSELNSGQDKPPTNERE